MLELDSTLRLVVAFAIIVIGSGVILPSYIMQARKLGIKRKSLSP
ncbi:MAG: hypothetical protein QXU32_09905 [Nitrososphaerales archaeon]